MITKAKYLSNTFVGEKTMIRSLLFLVIIVASTVSCGILTGPVYQPMKVPYSMTVVYLYAAEDLASPISVHVDGDSKTAAADHSALLQPGGYAPITLASGSIRVFVGDEESGSCVEILAPPDSSHFVRIGGNPLAVQPVRASDAEKEIRTTHAINPEFIGSSNQSFATGQCTMH